MTPEEHKERHKLLHKNFDEVFADFIQHAKGRSSNPIRDLIEWSYKQTIKPDHKIPDRQAVDFTEQELREIYDSAVNELECTYKGDLEDVDVAEEIPGKFDIDDADRVLRLQSIIIKTDEAIKKES